MFISESQRVRRSLVENEDLAIHVAIDRERKRIARDLHDGVVQQITYVVHKLEFIQRQLEMQQTPAALSEMKHAYSVLRDSLDDLRHSITSLVPDQLEKGGLAAALEKLIDGYRLDYPDLELSCDIVEPRKLPSGLEVPIFRVVQEALTNIGKHAYAWRVSIHIYTLSTMLIVEVRDNGIGFRPEAMDAVAGNDGHGWHLGLRGLRERVQEAGGVLEVQSQPGEGTTLRARFPLVNTAVVLTNRERDVLRLIVEGLPNRAIAHRLSISEKTVKAHIHHIMQKMHAKDRTQAAVVATRYGLLG